MPELSPKLRQRQWFASVLARFLTFNQYRFKDLVIMLLGELFPDMDETLLTTPLKRRFIANQLNDSIDRFPPVELDTCISNNCADVISRFTVFDRILKPAPFGSDNRSPTRHGLCLCEAKILVVMQREVNQHVRYDVELSCLYRIFVTQKMHAVNIESQLRQKSRQHTRHIRGVHAELVERNVLQLSDDHEMEIGEKGLQNTENPELCMHVLFQRDPTHIQQNLVSFLKTQFSLECLSL